MRLKFRGCQLLQFAMKFNFSLALLVLMRII